MNERLTIADAVHELASEHGIVAKIEDRTIRLPDPVRGSPHLAVLQALGVAADDSPVGAAAHGPGGVAAGVWQAPDLYVVRWMTTNRWVAHYRFTSRGRPDDYLREDSGIPQNLNRANWRGTDVIPDEVNECFFAVGLLLDEPPFPVPKPPPPPPEPEKPAPRASARASTSTAAARPRTPAAPRPRKKAAPPAPKKAVPQTKTCAMCNLQKHVTQFEAGSDLCVDCR